MKDGIKIIDADMHVVDSEDTYRKILPPPLNKWGGALLAHGDNYNRTVYGKLGRPFTDAQGMMRDMDIGGVDTAVIFPTIGLLIVDQTTTKPLSALVTSYNNWIAQFCKADPQRLKAAALLNFHDVKDAIQELRRSVSNLRVVGCILSAGPRFGNYGDERFYPIYEEAEKLDLPVLFHPTMHYPADLHYRFDNMASVHALAMPFGLITQVTGVITGGILDVFRKLRVAFLEIGVSWVPFIMERLDREFELRGDEDWPLLKKEPSYYIRSGRCYFTCEADEKTLPYVARYLGAHGEDVIMFTTDWPHWDTDWPNTTERLMARKDISDRLKRKILQDNPADFYRLF